MAERISLPTSAAYNLPVNIEGIGITIRIYWEDRTENWYMDVFDEDGVAIENRIKVVTRQPLIIFNIGAWPLTGNLFVAPTTSETEDDATTQAIFRDNFGGDNNYQLFYVPRNEYGAFISRTEAT